MRIPSVVRGVLLGFLLAVATAAVGCRRAPSGMPAPEPPPEVHYCFWTSWHTAEPLDTVAARYERDSTQYRDYAAIVPSDSASGIGQQLALCGDFKQHASVRAWGYRSVVADDTLPVWRLQPAEQAFVARRVIEDPARQRSP